MFREGCGGVRGERESRSTIFVYGQKRASVEEPIGEFRMPGTQRSLGHALARGWSPTDHFCVCNIGNNTYYNLILFENASLQLLNK